MTYSYIRQRLRLGQRAWLYYFPLLFLPNLGFGGETPFGVLELSDALILPYLFLIWFHGRQRKRTINSDVTVLMFLFVGWALTVSLLISVRYDYRDNFYLMYSILKLTKFVLYGLAGMLTARALVNDRVRREFVLSLALAGVAVGIGLCVVGQKSAVTAETQSLGYKASNAASVMAAILACYLCGLWLRRKTEKKSRYSWLLPVSMACLFLGSAISEGRGGWVAGIAGLLYLCVRGGLRWRSLLIATVVPVFGITLYLCSPVFQKRVDATFVPGVSGVNAVDDDGRIGNFTAGLDQFRNSPILGTGFYHRGGQTALYPSGSHNFFLQMFLETGVPGGLLMLVIFWRLWRLAGTDTAKHAGLEVSTKAALVAAAVGGMSGEYFYGALPLFTLLAVYASCGSLPARAGTFAVFRSNPFRRNRKDMLLLVGYARTNLASRRTLAAR